MIAHIDIQACTGCGTCATACPTHVFDAGPDGIPVVARLDQCQTCFMCELYCDADALFVSPDQRVPERVDADQIRAGRGSLRRGYRWQNGRSEHGSLDEFWRLGPLLREGAETAAQRYRERHPSDPSMG